MKYAKIVRNRGTRIAFFNSTPRGGDVAQMRHSLLRFLIPLGIDIKWYVLKPNAAIFRITKAVHNILQGSVDPSSRPSSAQIEQMQGWVKRNAERYWLRPKGPLAPRSEGGAEIVVVDDPQMSEVIRIAKEQDPSRPVIYRSHIELRDDRLHDQGSAAEQVWSTMFPTIKQADLFICHPVREFTDDLPKQQSGFMPAAADWIDGMNKELRSSCMDHYMHEFNQQCRQQGVPCLSYPWRPYIAQIARFDPGMYYDVHP